MPNLLQTIRPLLQTAFEGMAGTPVYWEDKPRPYAGPRTSVQGGIQGTIKIKELPAKEGFDVLRVREVPVSETRPSGFEFYDENIQEVIVTLKLWAWSQADEWHPHSYASRIASRLEQLDNAFRIALVDANIVPIEVLTLTTLDVQEDKRVTPTSLVDIRFRVFPEELPRVGYVIENVSLEGRFQGSANPSINTFNVGVAPSVTSWTPNKLTRPIVWWEGVDGLRAGSVWKDRIQGYELRPKGTGGAGDVSHVDDHIVSGLTSYMATDVVIPTTSRSQYLWAYMAHRTLVDPLQAVFLTLFHTSPGPWYLFAGNDAGSLRARLQAGGVGALTSAFHGDPILDRKVLVGAWVTPTTARLDVDGVAGPTVAHTASKARTLLQVGAWGGTGNGTGDYRSECEIYSVGVSEEQDIRSEIFGYVKTRYKGD